MEAQIESTKKHIHRNRAKYAAAATFTACAGVYLLASRQWNDFLKENDLYEQFYNFNEE